LSLPNSSWKQHREQWGWGGLDFRPWIQQPESRRRNNTGTGARPALTYTWPEDEIKQMLSGPLAMAFPNKVRNDVEMKFSHWDCPQFQLLPY